MVARRRRSSGEAQRSAPDHSELVEVAAAALRSERLFERDDHCADVLARPQRPEEPVAEPAARRGGECVRSDRAGQRPLGFRANGLYIIQMERRE